MSPWVRVRRCWVGNTCCSPSSRRCRWSREGGWETGGSFHWQGGREELGISQQRRERSHAFRAWERLPGCKDPFQPQSCHENLPCSCGQLALVALASLGCCGRVRAGWTQGLPARTGTGIWVWLAGISWTLLPTASFGWDTSLGCSHSPSAAVSSLPGGSDPAVPVQCRKHKHFDIFIFVFRFCYSSTAPLSHSLLSC